MSEEKRPTFKTLKEALDFIIPEENGVIYEINIRRSASISKTYIFESNENGIKLKYAYEVE